MATMESINAKANAGLATAIATAGATLLANGGLDNVLGGIIGGGGNKSTPASDAMAAAVLTSALTSRPCACESDHVVTRYDAEMAAKIANLEGEIKLRDSYIYVDGKISAAEERSAARADRIERRIDCIEGQLADQRVYNATNTAAIGCIQSQIAQLMSLTKIVVPNGSICPGWGNVTIAPAAAPAAA